MAVERRSVVEIKPGNPRIVSKQHFKCMNSSLNEKSQNLVIRQHFTSLSIIFVPFSFFEKERAREGEGEEANGEKEEGGVEFSVYYLPLFFLKRELLFHAGHPFKNQGGKKN